VVKHERRSISNNLTIEQLLNHLKRLFGIVGYIYDSYAELGKLCMRNQEELVNYVDRVQTLQGSDVYNQIIEAEKSSGGPPTDAEITKINKRFTRAFYCGLSSDIRTIEKRNDLSPSKMYEMAETANQELKARRDRHILLHADFRRIRCSLNPPSKG